MFESTRATTKKQNLIFIVFFFNHLKINNVIITLKGELVFFSFRLFLVYKKKRCLLVFFFLV